MPTISVVMPAYCAEKYIAQALDSVVAQTFTDWECIVIDDGSTDDTLAIIEAYAARDSRIRFETIKNSGAAKFPRDRAVSKAKGEWIVALDADDYLNEHSLGRLLERALQTDAEIVLQQMLLFDEASGEVKLQIPASDFESDHVMTGKEAFMHTIGRWEIGLSGAMIRTTIWRAKQTYLSAVNHMNVDEYDSREVLINTPKVAIAKQAQYWYRQYSGSVTKKISYKLFETLITSRMLLELIAKHLPGGTSSPFYRAEQRCYLRATLSHIALFTSQRSAFTSEDQAKAQQIFYTELRSMSLKQKWGARISIRLKILLSLPPNLLIKIYDWLAKNRATRTRIAQK